MITEQQLPRLKMHKLKRWLIDKDALNYSDNVMSIEINNDYTTSYIEDSTKEIALDRRLLRGILIIEYNENETTKYNYACEIHPDMHREYLYQYISTAKFELVKLALEWFERIENESPTASLYYAGLMDALYKKPFLWRN